MKSFSIGRVAFFAKKAETGTWEVTTADSKRTLYFSIMKITRDEQNMYGIIIGPFLFYTAYMANEDK